MGQQEESLIGFSDNEFSDLAGIEEQGIRPSRAKAVVIPVLKELPAALRTEEEWAELHLSKPLLRALNDLQFGHPTPIQVETIPPALEGRDILVAAETGSGKTLAFLLPCVERLLHAPHVRQRRLDSKGSIRGFQGRGMTKVLVMLPTRELAMQCYENLQSIIKYCPITHGLVSGAYDIAKSEASLRSAPDFVVATPGRCLDLLLNAQGVHFNLLDIVVFDEADKLLDFGFKDVCLQVLKRCSPARQSILCSATLSTKAKELAVVALRNPVWVPSKEKTLAKNRGLEETAAQRMQHLAHSITTRVIRIPDPKEYRFPCAILAIAQEHRALTEALRKAAAPPAPSEVEEQASEGSPEVLAKKYRPQSKSRGRVARAEGKKSAEKSEVRPHFAGRKIIVFFNTKRHARLFALFLQQNLQTIPELVGYPQFPRDFAELHGGLPADVRMQEYKKIPIVDLLIATDMAGRGLDISGVGSVVNVDLPLETSKFIHRAGRTGRAGMSGRTVVFYHPETQRTMMKTIWKETRQNPELVRNAERINENDKVFKKLVWLLERSRSDIKRAYEASIMERKLTKKIAEAEAAVKMKSGGLYAKVLEATPERTWIERDPEVEDQMRKKRRRYL